MDIRWRGAFSFFAISAHSILMFSSLAQSQTSNNNQRAAEKAPYKVYSSVTGEWHDRICTYEAHYKPGSTQAEHVRKCQQRDGSWADEPEQKGATSAKSMPNQLSKSTSQPARPNAATSSASGVGTKSTSNSRVGGSTKPTRLGMPFNSYEAQVHALDAEWNSIYSDYRGITGRRISRTDFCSAIRALSIRMGRLIPKAAALSEAGPRVYAEALFNNNTSGIAKYRRLSDIVRGTELGAPKAVKDFDEQAVETC